MNGNEITIALPSMGSFNLGNDYLANFPKRGTGYIKIKALFGKSGLGRLVYGGQADIQKRLLASAIVVAKRLVR